MQSSGVPGSLSVLQEQQISDLSVNSTTVTNNHTSLKQGRGKHLQPFYLLIPSPSDRHFDGFFFYSNRMFLYFWFPKNVF